MKKRPGLYIVGAYVTAALAAFATARTVDFSPLWTAATADLVATLVVFGFSVAADNSSVYDPYWSVAPPLIVAYWIRAGNSGTSLSILLALVAVWGVRLTANWTIRWQGLQDEDWRYREFRRASGRWYWPVSLGAIHLFPTATVFLGLLPVYFASAGNAAPTGAAGPAPVAIVAGVLIVAGSIALESVADNQLRAHRRAAPGTRCRHGLWAVVQHPNYVGELGFWLGLYMASLGLGAPWWTGVGVVAMLGVFFGYSIPTMNRHLSAKRRAAAGPAGGPAALDADEQ